MLQGTILLFGGPAAGKSKVAEGVAKAYSKPNFLVEYYISNLNIEEKKKELLRNWFYNYFLESKTNPEVPSSNDYKQLNKNHLKSLEEAFNYGPFSLERISTGDILREMKEKNELPPEITAIMKKGELVPNEYINKLIIKPKLQGINFQNFIADGYPRTIQQLEYLLDIIKTYDKENNIKSDRLIDFAVLASIEMEIAQQRAAGRRICPQHPLMYYNFYSEKYSLEKKIKSSKGDYLTGSCKKCGTELIRRPDDDPKTFPKRWKKYQEITKPTLEKLAAEGIPLIKIPGGMSVEYIPEYFLLKACRIQK